MKCDVNTAVWGFSTMQAYSIQRGDLAISQILVIITLW